MSCQATCCSIAIPANPSRDYSHCHDAGRKVRPFPWVRTLMRWQQRRCLLELDDHLLKDIGLTREQALEEARKSFWM